MHDYRSAQTMSILKANPKAYEALVVTGGTPEVSRQLLGGIGADQLLERKPASPAASQLTLAALWLWHDGLDECHHILQRSPEELIARSAPRLASFEPVVSSDPEQVQLSLNLWHAILHRREGDFSNGKYWYARAAGHPILEAMANHFGPAVNTMPADRLLLRMVARGFDPRAWVDFVADVHGNPSPARTSAAVHLQQLEWRVVFDFCMQI